MSVSTNLSYTSVTSWEGSSSESHTMCQPPTEHSTWNYEQWSLTGVDAWGWEFSQIKSYIILACLKPGPSPNLDNTTVGDLKRVYNRIISPAWDGYNPYIFDGEELRVEWACTAQGIPVPITDFYTAFSWVVSMTESPMPQATPAKYTRLLCTFSKWCDTVSGVFKGFSGPNTAAIFRTRVPSGPWQAHYGHNSEIFAIYTNLSQRSNLKAVDSRAKENARQIRKKHLEDILGDLGIEPKADSPIDLEKNTKFGHCAETLALTSTIFPDNLWCHMDALAVGTRLVVKNNQYIEASEDILESTAWKARKKICLNCGHLLALLRGMSGEDCVNYTDQWHTLKVEHDGHKEIHDGKAATEKKARAKAAAKAKEMAATVRSKGAAIRAKCAPESRTQLMCTSSGHNIIHKRSV